MDRIRGPMIIGLVLWLITGASMAQAGEGEVYDWPGEEAPVLVKNDSGVILIGKEGVPLRAFSWRKNDDSEFDRGLRLTDVSGDGTPEIVGSGTPTFVLNASGEPVFSLENGCRQVVLSDLVEGSGLDLVCLRNREVRVYTGDGQFAWSVETSRGLERCRAGDVTNNTRDDLECKFRGRERYLRLRPNGEILTDSAESARLEGDGEFHPSPSPVGGSVWSGDDHFDLDGDGRAEETLQVVDGSLEIGKSGKDEALKRIELDGDLIGAVVKDLDGEGANSVVVLTAGSIYVISEGGEEIARFSADASDYKRVPHVELVSVHANGFGDAREEANEVVRAVTDDVANCYAARLRAHPYAGSGRQLLQITVGAEGSVENVRQRHSDVGDRQVEECARKRVGALTFPETEEGGQGVVSVNMRFTFRDE